MVSIAARGEAENNALTTPGNSLHGLIAIDSGGKLKLKFHTNIERAIIVHLHIYSTYVGTYLPPISTSILANKANEVG